MGKIQDSDNWVNDRLGNLPIEFIDGDRSSRYPKKSEMVPNGIPFLNAKSIREGFLNLKKVNFITEDKFSTIKKGRLQYGDLILTTRGNGVGKLAYFGIISTKALINAQLLIVRPDNTKINPRFLYYSFCNPAFQLMLKNFTSGSAQPQLPITSLREVQFSYPSLSTQRKIAAILSAYDDLIENNTRRIKVLEEMAQALYREWFVKFRFPGHEKVKMVESELGMVPEGWLFLKLGDLCDMKYGKMPKKEDLVKKGYPVFSGYRIVGYHKQYLYKHPEIVVVARGVGGCGDIKMSPPFSYLTNLSIVLQIAKPYIVDQNFLYYRLFHTTLKELNTGAAQPQIIIADLDKYQVIIPPYPLQNEFSRIISDRNSLLQNLEQQNTNLRRTRDLLLPKLISGEVDVENIDVQMPNNGGA